MNAVFGNMTTAYFPIPAADFKNLDGIFELQLICFLIFTAIRGRLFWRLWGDTVGMYYIQ